MEFFPASWCKVQIKKEERNKKRKFIQWMLGSSSVCESLFFFVCFFHFSVVRKGTQNPVLLSFYMAIKARPIATLQRVTEQSISRLSLLTY